MARTSISLSAFCSSGGSETGSAHEGESDDGLEACCHDEAACGGWLQRFGLGGV